MHHCPTPHVHEVDVGGILVPQKAEDVDVVNRRADDDRPPPDVFQQFVAPLDNLGFFKTQFACQLLHLLHQHIHQHVGVTVQYLLDFADVFTVLLGRHQALAASFTAVDVVLQAQAVLEVVDCFT